MDGAVDTWLDKELAGCHLADERLNKRLRTLLAQVGGAVGQSIPFVCQDWANTKAAYRFLSNERVTEADILAGHFLSTRDRMVRHDGLVLMLQDTTEFTYQREKPEAIGITKSVNSGSDKAGRLRSRTLCGIMMHSSLAVIVDEAGRIVARLDVRPMRAAWPTWQQNLSGSRRRLSYRSNSAMNRPIPPAVIEENPTAWAGSKELVY